MAKSSRRSVRARRAEQQARRKRQRLLTYGLVGAGIVVVLGLFFWIGRTRSSPENVTLPDSLEAPPNADGKAWGPAGAPVLVEEYSDFQ